MQRETLVGSVGANAMLLNAIEFGGDGPCGSSQLFPAYFYITAPLRNPNVAAKFVERML